MVHQVTSTAEFKETINNGKTVVVDFTGKTN
jgi:hypothetical protein